jgi:hypothetical protein
MPPARYARPLLLGVVLASLATSAAAAPTDEQAWLDGLTTRVIEDLAAGEPLAVRVHVPLCDSSIIACGNAKLGDGDNLATNLYWATTPGFGRWFARKGSGWKRVRATPEPSDPDVLAVHVYRRTVQAPAAWRKRGAPRQLPIELEILAWRGTAIDRALAAYAADLGAGSAHIVAWVGHNRLMDLDHELAWPAPPADAIGTIAIACHTAAYMEGSVPAPTRVPLLLTRDYLFANAAPLEATVLAFAAGGGYAKLRRDAAAAYAAVQKREVRRVAGAFTNPADRRWKHHAR